MLERNWKTILVVAAATCAFVLLARMVMAKQDDKVYWCHTEPNGNQQTLHLPLQALQNAGHVSANGNPLHAGDHAGECVEPTVTPTNTPTATPTDVVEPSVTPTPSEEVTPTPTEEVTPTPTEEVTPEPTREPTQAPTAEHHEDAVLTNNTTSTPNCSDLTPTMVQDVWYSDYKADTLNKGMYQLDLHWGLNGNYNKVNIAYGRNIGEWQNALLGTENDGTETIHGLHKGTYWFQVAYLNGCAVGAYSHPVDP